MTLTPQKSVAGILVSLAITAFVSSAISLALHIAPSGAQGTNVSPSDYAALRWRLVGPFRGGRVLAVSGVSGNPFLFYFGSVDGGVWKTTDAGRTWNPIFDGQPSSSIGALAVAPSDPNIIYVGSGEADMRSDITYGIGMFKSSDAGATWQRIGLEDTRQIGRVVVDPHDPNRLFVAALGHAYAANAQRGVFRSLDGGHSWQRVLFTNSDTGAIDVAMDPSNHEQLLAALWQTRRPPWNVYPPSDGPGSGLYRSNDGGSSWRKVTGHGFPSEGLGRMGIAFAPSDSRRIYLLVAASHGGLYRSDDRGAHFRLADSDSRLWQRGWYFGGITVDPQNPNTVYVNNTALYRSTDGGRSFTAIKGSPDGDDFHSLWIDPHAPQRMISGSDQGASVTPNGGVTWSTWFNQPTGQFYHVATDNQFPFALYGAQQDSGAAMVLSRSVYSSLTFRDWRAVSAGGESDTLAPDPSSTNLIFGGRVDRYNVRSGQNQAIDPTLNHPDILWRDTWTLPLAFSPADPKALYFARQVLFRSIDSGMTWKIISHDLTRPNPGVPVTLDKATVADNLGIGARRGVIYCIAPSPLRAGQVWVGTDDGKVWVTHDTGAHWNDVTPPQLTAWSKVGILEASHFDANVAYAAVDRHRLDDLRPYIYRTRDGGATWQLVTNGIPEGSYVNAVREDPVRRGLLYAGTETGVEVSFDDGNSWLPLALNLPAVSVRDLSVRGDSLAIATHGRAFWVLDDLAPLRQLTSEITADPAWLFAPAPAVRVREGDDQAERLPPEEPAAANPPTGAFIDYELRSVPASGVGIEILDSQGRKLASWSSTRTPPKPNPTDFDYVSSYIHTEEPPTAHVGLNQFVWDFHAQPILGASDKSDAHGALVPPGSYSVRMTVGETVMNQPLSILKDPRVQASDRDLGAQFEMTVAIDNQRAIGGAVYNAALRAIQRIGALKPVGYSACVRRIRDAAGYEPPKNPANSVGVPDIMLTTVRHFRRELDTLRDAVQSADTAPTPDEVRAFALLKQALLNAMARVPKTECGVSVR